jgi:quinol-cytochrome oxidoreductase complex cytochrome b subunit
MEIPGKGFMDTMSDKGLKQAVSETVAQTTRAILAGISLPEMRALLRGDPPTEKPNPRYRAQVKSFLLHIRPKFYQEGSTWFSHTFRLGMLSTFFFAIEVITGLILMVYYTPSPDAAYYDMLNILSNVNLGKFMRDMHRLGAELMVIAVTLHMVRVYFTGAYKHPRQFTWLTGVALLLITLFLSFSGYLLPWDQLAYWAVTIGTSMAEAAPLLGYQTNLILRGSQDIGAGGLLRFYLLHVFMLPLVAIVLISIHYYKVAREHSISLPAAIEENLAPPEKVAAAKRKVDLLPDLLTSELMWYAIVLAGMVVAVATFFSAPLETHADPLKTPLHTTAPWYFLWLQGMLKLGDKTFWGVVIPTIIFGLLFAIPYIDVGPSRLAKNRKLGVSLGVLTTVLIVLLSYMGTGLWGVAAPPPVELVQEFIPEEGVGPVRAIPYEQLTLGSFDTDNPATYPSGELGHIIAEMAEAAERESLREGNNFFEGKMNVKIENWQTNLKKFTVTVFWEEVPEGSATNERVERTFVKTFYFHQNSHYELLE